MPRTSGDDAADLGLVDDVGDTIFITIGSYLAARARSSVASCDQLSIWRKRMPYAASTAPASSERSCSRFSAAAFREDARRGVAVDVGSPARGPGRGRAISR